MNVVGAIGQQLGLSQVELGYVSSSMACNRWLIKPPGHRTKASWHCAKWELGMCPNELATPYFAFSWLAGASK